LAAKYPIYVKGFDKTQAIALNNNNNADAVAMISDIYQMVK